MELRYPDVPRERGHYESVYFVATHPTRSEALWLRTTVRKKPGQDPVGAIWATWFTEDGVKAAKVDDQSLALSGTDLLVGPAANGPGGSRGKLASADLDLVWDLDFTPTSPGLEHLHPAFLYSAPFPRTKPTSPLPSMTVAGSLTVDGTPVDLTGWTGMLGHNWGSQHAARWIWLRAAGLGADGSGWLDAVLARVRIGPVLTPWSGFGALDLDGRRTPLGGLLRRDTAVDLDPAGARITLGGPGVTVLTDARVPLASAVGWKYADPDGHGHEVVNCSVARTTLTVRAGGGAPTVLTPTTCGVLEVGGDTRAFDVPLQEFED